ncbi:MAG: hypothetical protein AAFY31_04175 [Pseudomonadota bacterium]
MTSYFAFLSERAEPTDDELNADGPDFKGSGLHARDALAKEPQR